jgi:hypothetical protein
MLQFFLFMGADADARDNEGRTALDLCDDPGARAVLKKVIKRDFCFRFFHILFFLYMASERIRTRRWEKDCVESVRRSWRARSPYKGENDFEYISLDKE